jgi:hypothetical protein
VRLGTVTDLLALEPFGLGLATPEAVHLAGEDVAAAGRALPVAGAHVAAAAAAAAASAAAAPRPAVRVAPAAAAAVAAAALRLVVAAAAEAAALVAAPAAAAAAIITHVGRSCVRKWRLACVRVRVGIVRRGSTKVEYFLSSSAVFLVTVSTTSFRVPIK